MKIKFVSNGLSGEVNQVQLGANAINPAYFFLKAYYQLHGHNPDVQWLPCDFLMLDPVDVQLAKIIDQQPDLVGLSVYVWNEEIQYYLAKEIKAKLPDCVIVLGGPQLVAHKDPDYFIKYPYIDYVCYGDGEEAFQLLIDKISGHLSDDAELVNMVENSDEGYKLWPLKILSDELYLSTSSFLIQKQEVINSINRLIDRGVPKNQIILAIEFARGCMYNCSFCDWSQNLTKKVKRRTHDWKAELDFFKELDITLRETDANFGQWPQDLEIFDYGLSLYDPNKNFKLRIHNTPKLKKEVTYYLQMTQTLLHGFRIHVALQDINDQVLVNINRPSISWTDQKELLLRMHRELPDDKKHLLGIQVISGLPGQTYESIVDMLVECASVGVRQIAQGVWVYLDNSPASDVFYQKTHQLEWIDAYFLVDKTLPLDNVESLYAQLSEGVADPRVWTKLKIVKKSSSMGLKDLMKAQLFMQYFNQQLETGVDDLAETKENINQRVIQEIDYSYQIHQPLIDKYNIVLFTRINDNHLSTIYAN
jgi:tRNA A37 methylthiotransferase MiaB